MHKITKHSSNRQKAIADLCIIAFYYLLRAGEYTHTGKDNTRTEKFTLKDITFFKGNKIIDFRTNKTELHTADKATLRIRNQKNGNKSQCITHWSNGKSDDPIKALARRVRAVWDATHDMDAPICKYLNHQHYLKDIRSTSITETIKSAAKELHLEQFGIPPSKVSSHSLRAGGAMALHLNGARDHSIQKMGRWSSGTFMTYIHAQISCLSKGLSKLMSTPHTFINVARSPQTPLRRRTK